MARVRVLLSLLQLAGFATLAGGAIGCKVWSTTIKASPFRTLTAPVIPFTFTLNFSFRLTCPFSLSYSFHSGASAILCPVSLAATIEAPTSFSFTFTSELAFLVSM